MRTGDEKILLMYKEYGRFDGLRCRNCPHLEVFANEANSRIWYKCLMFGTSNGPATDWRCSNIACGAFRIDPEDAKQRKLYGEIFRRVKGLRVKRVEQLPGQMEMEEVEG